MPAERRRAHEDRFRASDGPVRNWKSTGPGGASSAPCSRPTPTWATSLLRPNPNPSRSPPRAGFSCNILDFCRTGRCFGARDPRSTPVPIISLRKPDPSATRPSPPTAASVSNRKNRAGHRSHTGPGSTPASVSKRHHQAADGGPPGHHTFPRPDRAAAVLRK